MRLSDPRSRLEYHWKRDLGGPTGLTLHQFIKLGRAMWALQRLRLGDKGGVARVAHHLRVSDATVLRDFTALTGRPFREHRTYEERQAVRDLLKAFGVGGSSTW